MPRISKKLNWADRNHIYRTRWNGEEPFITGSEIAALYNITPAYVSYIRNNQRLTSPERTNGKKVFNFISNNTYKRYKEVKELLAKGYGQKEVASKTKFPLYVIERLYKGLIGQDIKWPNNMPGGFIEAYGIEAHKSRKGRRER